MARNAVLGWDDLALRREALVLIGVLEREVEGGQRQLLPRMDNYSLPPEVLKAVFAPPARQ